MPTEYEKMWAHTNDAIKRSEFVSISTDSWTDCTGKHIMNFIIHTPRPYLYSFADISETSETGELVAEQLKSIIDTIGPNKIVSIVTDNATVMKKSWKITQNFYPWIQVKILEFIEFTKFPNNKVFIGIRMQSSLS